MLNGLHERVGGRRFVNRVAQRKIEHVDAEQMPVGDRELDRSDDVVGRALALAVEHLEPDEAGVGRDADKFASDQPGDVRAVTILVVRRDSLMPPLVKS